MSRSNQVWLPVLAVLGLMAFTAMPGLGQSSFITFESGQVRPLALSDDGTELYAVNTPDNQLEIFDVTATGISHRTSVPVGLEPVAVGVAKHEEVWVVNFLSDSVSIVDVAVDPPRVVRTLLVGDEPRDIVFAGPAEKRAFITTAHRGQHRTHPSIAGVPGAGDPQLATPSVPRADVWVFKVSDVGETLGGTPLEIVELFSDTPRALAASPDGKTVYAAAFSSGNQTSIVNAATVCVGFDPTTPCDVLGTNYPGGNAGPATNIFGEPAPQVGIVVKFNRDSGKWEDELGRDWSAAIRLSLPDLDVFAIDAETFEQTDAFAHVGTTLFNMVVNPITGNLYVSNTEAVNEVRFEGPKLPGLTTVQGHLAEARVTVVDPTSGTVTARHLNKHIDYNLLPAPAGTKEHSLATPLQMAVAGDGTLYIAAFGSSKVGVYDSAALENDSFDPTVVSADHIAVSGGGPSGLALDESRNRLYVLTRFDNSISVVDTASGVETSHVAMHNPEPASVVAGRPFLYDAQVSSSNGEASCSSCHIFGDMDQLAWDLGDPSRPKQPNPIPINLAVAALFPTPFFPPINGSGNPFELHSMKGPMTTQTLRGMSNSGSMHWRGDRALGIEQFLGQSPVDPFSEAINFLNFRVAFAGLNGRADLLPRDDMLKFTDFILQVTLPPNPIRSLDNSLTESQERGKDFFIGCSGPNSDFGDPECGHRTDGIPFEVEPTFGPLGFTCEGCHRLDPSQGFFGTGGNASFEDLPQMAKIPHLRNVYQKIGMFGFPDVPEVNPGNNGHQGDQIRGFGFLHDGSVDDIFRFVNGIVFNPAFGGLVGFTGGDAERRDVQEFMHAFDTDLAPIVGQQVTLDSKNGAVVGSRIDLMIERAGTAFASQVLGPNATECDLVVKGVVGGNAQGWLFDPAANVFNGDSAGAPALSDAALRALAATKGQELTYTCVPPGSGTRIALDRDEDGVLNGDE